MLHFIAIVIIISFPTSFLNNYQSSRNLVRATADKTDPFVEFKFEFTAFKYNWLPTLAKVQSTGKI
jgi:hypothetical protein